MRNTLATLYKHCFYVCACNVCKTPLISLNIVGLLKKAFWSPECIYSLQGCKTAHAGPIVFLSLFFSFFCWIESHVYAPFSLTKCTNSKGLYTDLLPSQGLGPTSARKAYTHSIEVFNKEDLVKERERRLITDEMHYAKRWRNKRLLEWVLASDEHANSNYSI